MNNSIMKPSLFFLLIVWTLVSCTSRPHYVIGVSSCSNDMWRDKLNEELTVSTYLYDNVEIRIASANDNDRRQIAQIHRFIEQGVDLLIVSPNQLKTISPAIIQAYKKHIPVVLFDRETDTDKYTAYIGADNFKVGSDMGEYVAQRMKGHGRLVVVNGLRGSSPSIERRKGFMNVIRRYPGIKIVAECHAGWLKENARREMDKILDKTTDFDFVFAQNDNMALGAREAVMARKIQHPVKYIGVDALPVKGGGLECVNKGVLDASYIYPTRGDLVMKLAMNILEGKPYKRENTLTGALVTKSNAGVLLLQDKELTNQRSRLYALHDKVNQLFTAYNHQRLFVLLALGIIVLLALSFVLVVRIISIKRRMEEHAAEEKMVFFTNVSHEFRNPLTLIADPADRLITDPSLTPNQRSLARIIRYNADILLRLVGEILDFRKVQKGKMPIHITRFNLAKSIELWSEGFRVMAQRKGVDLVIDTDDALVVAADYDKMEKICYNLLSNAVKYTGSGGRITLSAHVRSDGKLSLVVADNGQGMEPGEARHVFDRFYQASHAHGGTGIGLALVKAFAEMHGGSVSVKSKPGEGSVFTVVITQMKPEQTEEAAPEDVDVKEEKPEEFENTAEHSRRERITSTDDALQQQPVVLLVDDSRDIRQYLTTILSADYDVREAADGNAGLQLAIGEVPDIVISDVKMPSLDGMELCRRLKQEISTSHIPVILLTAQTKDDMRAEGYDCGADAYITKPFSSKVILARVRNLLDNRRQLKAVYSDGEAEELKPADADSRFIIDFHRVVKQHLGDSSLSVETVSAELGLSRVQMYRKVKQLTGSTPVDLIRVTRLKKAEKLLRQKGRTVAEVSYEVGFSSPSYFTKCFKEYFNRLPSEPDIS